MYNPLSYSHTRLISALGLSCAALLSFSTAAQSLDNKGTDFIVAMMPNYNPPTVQLQLTADSPTTVTVNYPVNSPTFTTTVAVNPGAITVVNLPQAAAQGWSDNSIQNNCIRAFASSEFVCYLANLAPFSSDAALALPIDTMNTEYIVLDYNPTFYGNEFTVVAGYDNTHVTIVPKTAMVGRPAGVPFTVTLQRGEGYHARSLTTAAANTLSGTTISTDRPVGLVNGDGCQQVPTGTPYCDHTFEVAQPVASWGKSVPVVNLPQRLNGSLYRVMAAQDGTVVSRDGVVIGTINRTQYLEFTVAGNHLITANNPIFVVQFMTSVLSPGATSGDPAMGNMVPAEQFLNHYTFATLGQNQFVSHFLTVIAQNADVGSVLLDGTAISAAAFSPIPGSTLSGATVRLNPGTHTSSSPHPHGITVEGYNEADSYLYPGGALFQFINPQGDANPPICQSMPPSVDLMQQCGTATDNRPSEDTNGNLQLDPGEDLNNNGQIDEDTGIFFVQLEPGSVNLLLTVNPFTPGDPSVAWCVTRIDPNLSGTGKVIVTDGAGNICSTDIALLINENQPPVPGATIQKIASGAILTLTASDDATPVQDIKIWILDVATPGFKAGPFHAGDVIVLRKNPRQAPYWRPLGPPYTAQVQTKGQALLVGEDDEGGLTDPGIPVP